MPDVLAQLGVNKATMGLTLFAGPVGALVAALFAAPLMARLSAGRVGALGVAVISAMLYGIALSHHWLVMASVVFIAGAGGSCLDIGANAATQRLETLHGRKYMAQCHAFWSLGFMAGALAAGLFGQLGFSLPVHLAIVASASLAAVTATYFILPRQFYLPVPAAANGEKRCRGEEGSAILQPGDDGRVDHAQLTPRRLPHPAMTADVDEVGQRVLGPGAFFGQPGLP